jgi:hypothetical protein
VVVGSDNRRESEIGGEDEEGRSNYYYGYWENETGVR